jgi:hypothetical protein
MQGGESSMESLLQIGFFKQNQVLDLWVGYARDSRRIKRITNEKT